MYNFDNHNVDHCNVTKGLESEKDRNQILSKECTEKCTFRFLSSISTSVDASVRGLATTMPESPQLSSCCCCCRALKENLHSSAADEEAPISSDATFYQNFKRKRGKKKKIIRVSRNYSMGQATKLNIKRRICGRSQIAGRPGTNHGTFPSLIYQQQK